MSYVHMQETDARAFQELLFPKFKSFCSQKVCQLINLLGLDVREKQSLADTYLALGYLQNELCGDRMFIDKSEVCTYHMNIL